MSGKLDFHELSDYRKVLLDVAKTEFPRETKNFMGRVGNSLARNIRASYSVVGKKTGNLRRGVSRGRPFIYNNNEFEVRVYNKAPHGWLIEHGHNIIGHKPAKKVLGGKSKAFGNVADTVKGFSGTYDDMVEEFIDEMIEGGKL